MSPYISADPGYRSLEVSARPSQGYTIEAPGYSPLSVEGIVDTIKETVTTKEFLIGAGTGILVTILGTMLFGPKPRTVGSRIGSRVKSRKRRK